MWGNELDAYWLFQIDVCRETKLSQKLPFCYWRFYFYLHECKFQLIWASTEEKEFIKSTSICEVSHVQGTHGHCCVTCWQGEIQEMIHTHVHGFINTYCINEFIGEFQIRKHVNIKKQVMRGMGSTFDRKVRETLYIKNWHYDLRFQWWEGTNHKKIQFPHKGSEEGAGWPSGWWERVMGLQGQFVDLSL